MRRVPKKDLPEVYKSQLFANEVMLLPYYIAALNIEHAYGEITGEYEPFEGLCFADTLDLTAERQPSLFAERNTERVERQKFAPITVVIGNPPYKEKAKGKGAWIEMGSGNRSAPLKDWQPPKDWKVGTHAKHLRNLYIYFWRWASRKVFEPVDGQAEGGGHGIVAFISAAGFISGPAFERMRQDLRQRCHEIWVIDCTSEMANPTTRAVMSMGAESLPARIRACRPMSRTALLSIRSPPGNCR